MTQLRETPGKCEKCGTSVNMFRALCDQCYFRSSAENPFVSQDYASRTSVPMSTGAFETQNALLDREIQAAALARGLVHLAESRHDLDSIVDPAVIPLETQAAAHARWIQDSAERYVTNIRKGQPGTAEVELDDILKRVRECRAIANRVSRILNDPNDKPCPDCGRFECSCEVVR